MIQVVVLCGGDSDERQVSLRSGAAVASALAASGYSVSSLDPARQTPEYEQRLSQAAVVFPVLHGKGGEDGTIQAWLEARHIPYVGADARSSALCFDKWQYRQFVQSQGIVIADGELVTADSIWQSILTEAPFVLKPYDGGSSVDTFIVRGPATLDRDAIAAAFQRHPRMLLERLIDGQEITVGVLLDEALPVIEIIPPSDGEFDFENKYNGKTQEICPPQSVSAEIQQWARDLALRLHQLLGVRDISRTDMIVDRTGRLWVLETNTIPGMTDQSLLPKAARVAGYSMTDVVHRLVDAALARQTA